MLRAVGSDGGVRESRVLRHADRAEPRRVCFACLCDHAIGLDNAGRAGRLHNQWSQQAVGILGIGLPSTATAVPKRGTPSQAFRCTPEFWLSITAMQAEATLLCRARTLERILFGASFTSPTVIPRASEAPIRNRMSRSETAPERGWLQQQRRHSILSYPIIGLGPALLLLAALATERRIKLPESASCLPSL